MNSQDERETKVSIRRAPKISVFMVIGVVVGVLVALILTASFPIDPTVGFGPTFGYLALYGLVIGAAVGAIIALILDRISLRRSRTVGVEVDRLQVEDDDSSEPGQ